VAIEIKDDYHLGRPIADLVAIAAAYVAASGAVHNVFAGR
jgi:hypothetical protein